MELNGKPYQPEKNKLFRHRVFLKKCNTKGRILERQFHWIPPEETYDTIGTIHIFPEYFAMRTMFPERCLQAGIPFHNAIAFWNKFLSRELQLTDEGQYELILRATCNYGDFFTYATTRTLPETFVRLEDLNTAVLNNFKVRFPKEDPHKAILTQINRISVNLLESEQSIEAFDQFRDAWNFQLKMAQCYQQWKMRYDNLELSSYSVVNHDKSNDLNTLKPLVRIFRQYIQLLNGYSNSARHPDFKSKYDEFEAGKENELFFSFDQLVFLLKEHEELALIAPIYVLALFQQLTKKLYTGLSITSTTQLKVKLANLPNTKPQLHERAKSNTQIPRNIQVITYQILCEHFMECSYLRTTYDRALCDHILQFYLPLIGQPYFKVDSSQVFKITHSNKCYEYEDFEASKQWVHFLLEKIAERFRYSLSLTPDSIPTISSTNIESADRDEYIKKAEKLVDSDFVDRYLNIFIFPPDGLGCARISEKIQVELADLMDQTLAEAALTPSPFNSSTIEKLFAYEKGFHKACAHKIYAQYYEEVLYFLYDFIQSPAFLHGKPINVANKSSQGSEEDVSVWPPPQNPPHKLNVVNRPDFEYNEP